MAKPLPRAFVACFVAVLLLCSAVVAYSVFHQSSMAAKISKAQANLESAQGRLRKQEAEFAELQPLADATYAEEQRLRQQRKDMRAERNALQDELAALQERSAAFGEDNARAADAIAKLYEALSALEDIAGLTE